MPLPLIPLLRLLVHVPPRYVAAVRAKLGDGAQKAILADVERRLQSIGYPEVLSVMQDPTENRMFSAVARPKAPVRDSDGLINVVRADFVEEAPTFPSRPGDVRSAFDRGMTTDEDATLRRALAQDTNPRHLDGLATTFEPCFPVSSSLLRAKSSLLELQAARNREQVQAANARYMRTQPQTIPVSVGQRLADFTRSRTLTPHGTAGWPEVEAMWGQLGADPRLRTWRPLAWPSYDEARRAGRALSAFERQSNIPNEVLRDEVRKAATRIASEPFECLYGDLDPDMLALTRRQRDPVQAAARACVLDMGLGTRVVCPDRIGLVLPPDERDGFVSPSALPLALATMKPGWSRVRDVRRVGAVLEDLAKKRPAGPDEQSRLRASAQLHRATKAIERRRWVEWHRRAQEIADGVR